MGPVGVMVHFLAWHIWPMERCHPTPWGLVGPTWHNHNHNRQLWASRFLEFGDLQIPANATGPDHITAEVLGLLQTCRPSACLHLTRQPQPFFAYLNGTFGIYTLVVLRGSPVESTVTHTVSPPKMEGPFKYIFFWPPKNLSKCPPCQLPGGVRTKLGHHPYISTGMS